MNLWICNLGYWAVVVLATDEADALAKAKRCWDRAEGYETDREWNVNMSDDPDGAVVGWA